MYRIIKNIFRINREEIFGEVEESVTMQDVELALKEKRPEWIVNPSKEGFEVRYHISKQLYAGVSEYQKIDIIENENFGRMMFLNNDAQIAESDGYDGHTTMSTLYSFPIIIFFIAENTSTADLCESSIFQFPTTSGVLSIHI